MAAVWFDTIRNKQRLRQQPNYPCLTRYPYPAWSKTNFHSIQNYAKDGLVEKQSSHHRLTDITPRANLFTMHHSVHSIIIWWPFSTKYCFIQQDRWMSRGWKCPRLFTWNVCLAVVSPCLTTTERVTQSEFSLCALPFSSILFGQTDDHSALHAVIFSKNPFKPVLFEIIIKKLKRNCLKGLLKKNLIFEYYLSS